MSTNMLNEEDSNKVLSTLGEEFLEHTNSVLAPLIFRQYVSVYYSVLSDLRILSINGLVFSYVLAMFYFFTNVPMPLSVLMAALFTVPFIRYFLSGVTAEAVLEEASTSGVVVAIQVWLGDKSYKARRVRMSLPQ